MTSILVWGVGYVGLCTAVAFFDASFDVACYDIDEEKLIKISTGQSPIYEPGVVEFVAENKIPAIRRPEESESPDFIFVCVGTPSKEDGDISLKYLEDTSKTLATCLREWEGNYPIIVLKSTVLPGTTQRFKKALEAWSDKECGIDFGLIYSPEFLREGTALMDTICPDKVVIGYEHKKDADIFDKLYADFFEKVGWYKDEFNVLRTNYENAEMIKYTNNAFLATKISFINEIANICEITPGTDVNVIAEAIGYDHRIAPQFLRAGLGFGGSCFTKDIKALIHYAEKGKEDEDFETPFTTMELLRSTLSVNELQRRWVLGALIDVFYPEDFQDKTIGVLGLAFKPETDDVRDAPAIDIIQELLDWGVKDLVAYDPQAMENAWALLPQELDENFHGLLYVHDAVSVIESSDAVIICTEWDEFRKALEPEHLMVSKKCPIIIDGRRMFSPEEILRMKSFGIRYVGVGLGAELDAED